MMLLTGCSTTAPYVHTCPVAATYSSSDKTEAKKELNSIQDHHMLDTFLEDYAVLKQQSLDCWSK